MEVTTTRSLTLALVMGFVGSIAVDGLSHAAAAQQAGSAQIAARVSGTPAELADDRLRARG